MTPRECMRHPWLKDVTGEEDPLTCTGGKELDKENLKKFISRRRWHKMMNTFSALKRMGAKFGEDKFKRDLVKPKASMMPSEPIPLSKTSSSPDINVELANSDSSSENPKSFHRCFSATEASPALSDDVLAKTIAISKSSNHLDTLQEEYDMPRQAKEKTPTRKAEEAPCVSPSASTGAISKDKPAQKVKNKAPATPLVDQLLSSFHASDKGKGKSKSSLVSNLASKFK